LQQRVNRPVEIILGKRHRNRNPSLHI
jgi:hypothetical protein